MLSDRRQQILRALIEEYVAHALPVGSKTIAEQYHLGVSSATIRNELSALEGEGYIQQPHTSSGRIPTDAGYRVFVDDIIAADAACASAIDERTAARIRRSADALDELMERTTEELTRLTDCLSIVSAPLLQMESIRQLSLISLSNHQALLVVVFQDGRVANHHIAFDEEVGPERLRIAQDVLAELVAGKTLRCTLDSLASLREAPPSEPIVRFVIDELVSWLAEMSPSLPSKRVGMSSLMRKPEFQDSSSLLPLMEILEDDTVLLRMFDPESSTGSEVSVRIGKENADDKLAGVSVIAASYGRGDARGIVAVIGPKRMDYMRVIQAVRGAQSILGE